MNFSGGVGDRSLETSKTFGKFLFFFPPPPLLSSLKIQFANKKTHPLLIFLKEPKNMWLYQSSQMHRMHVVEK